MQRKTKWIVSGAIALAVLAVAVVVGARVAVATSNGDRDGSITGNALDKASAAALQSTGAGRVTGTEIGDEESYYEVEVTLDDGRQVDVHLDQNFKVIGQEGDADNPHDQDGPNDN